MRCTREKKTSAILSLIGASPVTQERTESSKPGRSLKPNKNVEWKFKWMGPESSP
jgi:hypothetical protein